MTGVQTCALPIWKLSHASTSFEKEVLDLGNQLVEATIATYLAVLREHDLRPVPNKPHYIFNLKDISKVIQGLCRASSYAIKKDEDIIKLWAHECIRVFQDRLINSSAREIFMTIFKSEMKTHLNKDWDEFITSEPLLFGNFVKFLVTGPDDKQEYVLGIYSEIADKDLLKTTIEEFLKDHNDKIRSRNMNLVLCMYAMEHIISIHRILSIPRSHLMTMGISGSGQKSLTSLAAFIGKFNPFRIPGFKKNSFEEWRVNIRKVMGMAGIDKTPTVFFLDDDEISKNAFLDDIYNLLTSNEIPNLYAKQGKSNELMLKLRENIQLHSKSAINSDEEALDILKDQVRRNLHIIISMSPEMSVLRSRLRHFPGLLEHTTIDWFLPWPEEALITVAQQRLTETELEEKEVEATVKTFVSMQKRVKELADEYERQEQFHYYVTPKHYLELLSIFKKLVISRKDILKKIKLYEDGSKELKKTELLVAKMQENLLEIRPKQQECNESATTLALSLSKKQTELQEETKKVQKDEELAEETKREADELQAKCQANYNKALPDLKAAEEAIKEIDPAAISTMQSLTSPAEALKPVAKAMCILLGIKPKLVSKSEPDYWLPKKIFSHKSMKKLTEVDYDKEVIPLAKVTELKKIAESAEFDIEKINTASPESGAIANWIRALLDYDQVSRDVAPLKAELQEKSAKAQAAQESLAKTSKELEEKKELFVKLKQDLAAAESQKKKFTQEIERTEKEIERARDLLDLLKNENKRDRKSVV